MHTRVERHAHLRLRVDELELLEFPLVLEEFVEDDDEPLVVPRGGFWVKLECADGT